jgi:hypothetical protein
MVYERRAKGRQKKQAEIKFSLLSLFSRFVAYRCSK